MGNDRVRDAMVLVVDEEPAGLLALQEMLQDNDHLMMTALTGSAARRILEQRPREIQAIVLEMALPDMDGFALLQWIKSQPSLSDVEVILQSTRLRAAQLQKALDFGAYFYLSRPLQASEVRAIVKAAVAACQL